MGMSTINNLNTIYKKDMAKEARRRADLTQEMIIEAKGKVRDAQEEVIEGMYAIQDLEGDVKVAGDDMARAMENKR